jgi:outer membrane protein OmpA-like peptidoglycan-associated protein
MKKHIIFGLILLFAEVLQAQEKGSYLFLNAGGGKHNIAYTIDNGTVKTGLGLTGNIVYNYFFSPNFGIGTGLGVQTYKSAAVLNYMSTNSAVDTDGDTYDYRIYYEEWEEFQKLITLDIPLGFNYQTKFGTKSGLLASAGIKVSVPIRAAYETNDGQIVTTGFYEQWNVELSDMPQHNFITITDFPSSKFTAKPAYSVYADLGYLHEITPKMNLYLGAYVNYGLNNFIASSDKFVYQQDDVYNGVMSSNLINKANLVSFGVKIGLNLHLSNNKTVPDENDIVTNIDTVKSEPEIIKVDTVKHEPEIVEIDTVKHEPDVVEIDSIKPDTSEVVVTDKKEDAYEQANKVTDEIELRFQINSNTPIDIKDEKYTELANILKANPDMKVHIIGHTCDKGSKEVNIRVGMKRANTAKYIFFEKGVPVSQITTESKYYLEPLVPNTSEENRAKNRRVEIIIK